jgi:hypothetical protein
MNQKLIQFQDAMHIKIKLARRQIADAVRRYWFRVFLLGLAAFLVNRKDLSIDLHLNAVQHTIVFERKLLVGSFISRIFPLVLP